MKTRILSFVTAGAIALSMPLYAVNDSISQAAEQRIEKSAKELAAETVELAASAVKDAKKSTKDLKEYVDSRLDDTIILGGEPVTRAQDRNELIEFHNAEHEREQEIIEQSFDFVERLGKGITFLIVVTAILIIVSSYLKRRQKYKIIEKAIENNYPLPPGFLGKDVRPTTVQHIHYTQGYPANGNTNIKNVTEFKVNDWANFRSGIKWCAWGLAFLLFFLIIDAPVWEFAIIPLIIGIGKLYASYKIQQSIDNANSSAKEMDKNEQTTPPPFQSNNSNVNKD